MYVEEVCEAIGVSNPFDMAKVEKIIESLQRKKSSHAKKSSTGPSSPKMRLRNIWMNLNQGA